MSPRARGANRAFHDGKTITGKGTTMSTRSNIIVERRDGTFKRIYCHSDGYLSHNGLILWGNYDTQEKCEALVALGDLSSLGREIGKKVDFDAGRKLYDLLHAKKISEAEFERRNSAIYSQCRAYMRDRKEKDCPGSAHESLAEAWDVDCGQEYTYVWLMRGGKYLPPLSADPDAMGFRDGQWFVAKDTSQGTQTKVDLEEALRGRRLLSFSDRWCPPWVNGFSEECEYDVNFCWDGKGYVHRLADNAFHRFDTATGLALWLDEHKKVAFSRGGTTSLGEYGNVEPNIWGAQGSFDKARHDRIASAKNYALSTLNFSHDVDPPAIAPDFLSGGDDADRRPYSFAELIVREAESCA